MRKVDGEIRIVLIGHRGVGKTELLKRLQFYFPQFQYFDLDQEIAQKLSNPVYKIFETFGEEYFRSKEIELAHELLAKKNVIVSLGAGFRLESLPENVRCIWIRRITDAEGRIFLDRPTLNSKLTPLDDFLSRFSKRNKSYYDSADFIYDMPEGMQLFESKVVSKSGIRAKEKSFFKDIFFQTSQKRKAILTCNPRNADQKVIFETIELRTDIYSAKDIIRMVAHLGKKHKIILSFRKEREHDLAELADIFPDVEWIDVDLELSSFIQQIVSNFPIKTQQKLIISSHRESVKDNLNSFNALSKVKGTRISTMGVRFKSSPVVKSFKELKVLFDWQQLDPKNRSIFPRSANGDWHWFRCFMLSKQSLNFVNDGFSNVADQPTVLDIFLYDYPFNEFAAIIGNPVNHSFSPVFHYDFMKKKGRPYFRIKIEEREFEEAMEILESLGLHAASITSPFKESMYRKYQKRLSHGFDLKSTNTILFQGKRRIEMVNTDTFGLLKTLNHIAYELLKRSLEDLTIILWGGSGVVAPIKRILPNVHRVASRSGQLPKGIRDIDILIWAAPRSLLTQIPKNCTIKFIFDLSYAGNSMGLELAKTHRIQYISGLEMFKEQGHQQQIFWSQFDECK